MSNLVKTALIICFIISVSSCNYNTVIVNPECPRDTTYRPPNNENNGNGENQQIPSGFIPEIKVSGIYSTTNSNKQPINGRYADLSVIADNSFNVNICQKPYVVAGVFPRVKWQGVSTLIKTSQEPNFTAHCESMKSGNIDFIIITLERNNQTVSFREFIIQVQKR